VRLTVAVPNMHRSSLQGLLGQEVGKVVQWVDGTPADVVIGLPGAGTLAQCPAWPGEEGALALIRAGFERRHDQQDMERLHEVGRALASEVDLDRLLERILEHGLNLMHAEGGSIYLKENERELLFAHTRNERIKLAFRKTVLPITEASMAGHVALTGELLNIRDVYELPASVPYRFNDSFDRLAGYRSTSMLVVPIRDTQGECLGVLQFINRVAEDGRCVPFQGADERMAQSLAGQTGVALKNAKLLKDNQERMDRLHEVGRALASEQNLDRLLELILQHGLNLLQAEGGSIYLKENERELLFANALNKKIKPTFKRELIPITPASMAGYVALAGEILNIPDAYQIPAEARYRFNDTFDRLAGYRSTSMLVVPIKDTDGEILGVLQIINRLKEDGQAPRYVPFEASDERLAQSLAGQAGVAIKNAQLLKERENLFEKFVDASVKAIEQRDPVTRGHSGRVAELTVGLAEAINRTPDGRFGPVAFTEAQLRELRYASLLHDFGKVGVREQVLVKSKKLDGDRLAILLQRLHQRQQEEIMAALKADWAAGRTFDPGAWAALQARHRTETGRLMETLKQSNQPSVMSEDVAQGLAELGTLRFTTWDGQEAALLEPADLGCLAIRRGSLSEAERLEIESHVTHTYEFLSKIPWTRDLAGIPEYAYAHHERLNGKGYPRQLKEPEIPLQSKAMAITDVFDALTAQDRPYKSAVPLAKSLDILASDARDGHLDADLLALFIEAKVFERTVRA